jgi:hypothetical protein
MDQRLCDVRAMRLVLRLLQDQLHGTAHAARIFSDQQGTCTAANPLCHATPKGGSPLARERVHETNRRATLDAVNEYVGEAVYLRIIYSVQAPY